jgi:hypothetical protein
MKDDNFASANSAINRIADDINTVCNQNLNMNMAAVALADILCRGKTKAEITDISHMLTITLSAVRAYLNNSGTIIIK